MSTSKKQKLEVVTPLGKAEWFSLHKEDKFGNYTATLHLEESPEVLKIISQIDALGEGKKPYEKQADGSFKIKMKSKSKGTKKTGEQYVINPPAVYNSLGKKLSNEEVHKLNIGNGSEFRVKLEFSSYLMVDQETQEILKGISSKVKSAQLGSIVEFSGGDADSGFGALEFEESASEPEGAVQSDAKYDF